MHKVFSVLLLICLAGVSAAQSPNLLSNGDFNAGLNPWIFNQSVYPINTNYEIEVNPAVAGNPWDWNLSYPLSLEGSSTYTLQFRAKASTPREIIAGWGMNYSPWLADVKTFNLTSEWQTYTFTASCSFCPDALARVLFDMGQATGTVFLDDVSLIQESTAVPAALGWVYDDTQLEPEVWNWSNSESSGGSFYEAGNQWNDIQTSKEEFQAGHSSLRLHFAHNGSGYAAAHITTNANNPGYEALSAAERDGGKDVSSFNILSLWIKGDVASDALIRLSDTMNQISSPVRITSQLNVSSAWQQVQIPLDLFTGVDLTQINTVSVGVDETISAGDFVFYLDTIEFITQPSEFNEPPVAIAESVKDSLINFPLILDAGNSFDPDNEALSYSWAQVAGPEHIIEQSTDAVASIKPTVAGEYSFQVTVSDGSTNDVAEISVTVRNNARENGPYATQRQIYASAGLDYGNLVNNQLLPIPPGGYRMALTNYADYHLFSDSMYSTQTLDLSDFGIGNYELPPVTDSAAPINGVFYKPVNAQGPFPLAVFVHGNHHPLERSEPGYETYCETLASHGFIATAIDNNFLNGISPSSVRGIVTLEHIKQFKQWNEDPAHELYQKIDLENVILIGHSRGGRGVGLASVFNQYTLQGRSEAYFAPEHAVKIDGSVARGLGPWGFNIRAVMAIAPTTSWTPLNQENPNEYEEDFEFPAEYFLVMSGRDGDVGPFSGYYPYVYNAGQFDPLQAQEQIAWSKGYTFFHRANHNGYNTVWAEVPEGSLSCSRYQLCYSAPLTMCKTQQKDSLKAYINAVALGIAKDNPAYYELVKSKNFFQKNIPQTALQGDCSTPIEGGELRLNQTYFDKQRMVFAHFDEDEDWQSLSPFPGGLAGRITNNGNCELTNIEALNSGALSAACPNSGYFNVTLEFDEALPLTTSNQEEYGVLAFDIKALVENTQTNFDVIAWDGNNMSYQLNTADIFPSTNILPAGNYIQFFPTYGDNQVREQTVRVPLSLYSPYINIHDIRKIELVFESDVTNMKGEAVKINYLIDNFQITK